MTNSQRSALVVGGGIIGLATAYRLARAGHAVRLFDPNVAHGATWAAAGMIAPSAEIAPGEESNYKVQLGALPAWREFSDELFTFTGERVNIVETGTLLVGWDASDRRMIDQFAKVAEGFDAPVHEVMRDSSPHLFEGISARIRDGLVLDGDAWLDPDDVVRVLRTAIERLGVAVIEEHIVAVESSSEGVLARSSCAEYRADRGVLATGAAQLPSGATTALGHVVRPVRGVTVRVQGPDRSDQPTIRAFVRGRAFYMVSRPGGYCVLGATAEEKAQPIVEVGELQRLLRDALDIVPELESAPLLEARNGLRPASTDLRPFFVELDQSGWAWSSGHYRHGVTLAPIAANDAVRFAERA